MTKRDNGMCEEIRPGQLYVWVLEYTQGTLTHNEAECGNERNAFYNKIVRWIENIACMDVFVCVRVCESCLSSYIKRKAIQTIYPRTWIA